VQSLSDISNETMFEGISQIPAGHFAEIDLNRDLLKPCHKEILASPSRFDSLLSMEDTVERVRSLFLDSVRLRLRSDVPVGVLLSGGVDSTAITCAMDSMVARDTDMNLLSVTSNDSRFDESPFIDKVGIHLGRKVHKVCLNPDPQTMLGLLRTTSWFNDAPLNGFETVLHYLLMQKAEELGITVVLSGQGRMSFFVVTASILGSTCSTFFESNNIGRRSLFLCNSTDRGPSSSNSMFLKPSVTCQDG